MDFVGVRGRYFARLRGEVEDTEVIRTVSGKFDPRVYRFYKSYAVAGVKEVRSYGSVWTSPKMIAAALFLVVGGAIVFARPWLSGAKETAAIASVADVKKGGTQGQEGAPIVPPGATVAQENFIQGPVSPIVSDLCVVGAFRVESEPWRYVVQGRGVLTAADLSVLLGVVVTEQEVSGVGTVFARGLNYQPCNSQTERG
jgi:hypothetical protein